MQKHVILMISCASICTILGGMTIRLLSPESVDPIIFDRMVISPKSERIADWLKPNIYPITKVYFFTVVNHKNFIKNGEKPVFKQIGPYTYEERPKKVKVHWENRGAQVSFLSKSTYHFRPELSSGSESDLIRTLNVILVSAAEAAHELKSIERFGLHFLLSTGIGGFGKDTKPIVTLSVKELLWGHKNSFFEFAKRRGDPDKVPPYDMFGLFVGRNDSVEFAGRYTMETGKYDKTKMGNLAKWNDADEMKTWPYEKVYGSDGSAFPPNVNRSSVLTLFNPELCRSLPLVYKEDDVRDGVPIYRFQMSPTYFDPAANENKRYCDSPKPEICGYNGTFMAKRCKFGTPIVLSKPHFLGGDPRLFAYRGISPKVSEHDSYFDIVPKLGVPISVKVRVQANLMISSKTRQLTGLTQLKDMVFPLFWSETGIESLPEDVLSQIKMGVFYPPTIRWGVGGGFLAVALILIVVAIISITCRTHPKSILKQSSSDPLLSCPKLVQNAAPESIIAEV